MLDNMNPFFKIKNIILFQKKLFTIIKKIKNYKLKIK